MNLRLYKTLKVPSHKSYTQRRAPPHACLHREKMAPFPLALGFNAAIPPRSRVAICAEVSRAVFRAVTLCTQSRARICRTSSDAPHSLPFWHVCGALDEVRQQHRKQHGMFPRKLQFGPLRAEFLEKHLDAS